MKKILFLILLLIIAILPFNVFAATYYISPSGNDGGDGSTGSPWKTFSHSFGEMSAADTLILKDGTYSIAAGTGCINFQGTGSAQIPSGTDKDHPTIVMAENEGSATVDGAGGYNNIGLFVGRSTRLDSYIKVQGITFEGGGDLFSASYTYIKNCGFHGPLTVGSPDANTHGTYNLIEDVWIWVENRRIAVQNYMSNYCIWRRVIIRSEGTDCGSQTGPEVGFTIYNSQHVIAQNVIVIDRQNIADDTCYGYADFATAQHLNNPDYYLHDLEWHGCMSINSEDQGVYFESDYETTPSHTLTNMAVINTTGQGYSINVQGTDTSVTNSLVYRDNVEDATEGGYFYGINSLDYVIGVNRTNRAINGGGTVPYANITGPYTIEELIYTTVTNKLTSNPLNDGDTDSIKYPVRIETGSVLAIAGYAFDITKKHGVDGTFYGDTGYNTLTANLLWPWANEDRIKTEMEADSDRGFTAYSGLDGAHNTLTSYVWEVFGNEIPADIYGDPPAEDTTDPTVAISDSKPKTLSSGYTTTLGFTSSDANGIDECKWRSGSAPDESNGTACTGTTSGTCSVTGIVQGDNTIYVGCADPSNNWGSDSITVNAPSYRASAGGSYNIR
jgi:hypothetical protein